MAGAEDSKLQNILVFGATGLIGQHITNALLAAKSNFRKIGIFTSASSIQKKATLLDAFKAQGAEIFTADLQNEDDVKAAYRGFDTVVSPVGRDAIPMQTNLIRWAEESESIKRYFPSEFGTDIEYSAWSTTQPIHQQKLHVRAYIREHTKRLEHTYLMTGPYGDYYITAIPPKPQIGSYDPKEKKAWLLEPVDQKISFTTRHDVGRFLVAALLHPDVSRNKALKVQSFVASHADILSEYERQMGGKKWEVEYTSPDQLRELTEEAWKEDKWWKATCSLRQCWMRGESLYPEFDNKALGIQDTQDLSFVLKEKIAEVA